MNYLLLLISLIHFNPIAISGDIEVKSIYKIERGEVVVQINLPNDYNVGFELYDEDSVIQHLWHDQSLSEGPHLISLDIPELSAGKYFLHIRVGDETFKHLVYQPVR